MSYTLGLIHNGKLNLSSLLFDSIDSSQKYISNLTSKSFQILEISDTNNKDSQLTDENTTQMSNELNGMFLHKYGQGYLLKCDESDQRWGTKYFHNGWWMPTQNSWFYKKEFADELLELGAQIWKKNTTKSSNPPKTIKKEFENLTGMILTQYGKGLSLKCDSYDKRWGEKYFLTGWWMPTIEGWFFKDTEFDYLIGLGAEYLEDECLEHESTDFDSEDTNWSQYGKGWLLTPTKDHPEFGDKYFNGGWWMPKHNAWFFKNSEKSKLVNH